MSLRGRPLDELPEVRFPPEFVRLPAEFLRSPAVKTGQFSGQSA